MDAEQLLLSRIEDLIWDYECNKDSFLGFLNEQEAAVACSYLKNRGWEYILYGGYDNSTRVYISLSVDISKERFPITAVLITSKGKKTLSHRDYLGSLMGIGIKRECVGDIITINPQEAVVFLREEITEFVFNNLSKVGSDTVKLSLYKESGNIPAPDKEEIRVIVSSMRVDNIISSLIKCSRNLACEFISDDKVFVNYLKVKKPAQVLVEDDVISIRGYGKYIIGTTQGTTKRDRLIINALHYI